MKNHITIDSKIGYLQPKTGKYKWSTVIGMNSDTITMQHCALITRKTGILHTFTEKTEDIIQWLKTPSPDWKDGRPLLKHKGCNKPYLTK